MSRRNGNSTSAGASIGEIIRNVSISARFDAEQIELTQSAIN